MTTLRTAAQQALEALEFYKGCYGASQAEEAIITALSTALAATREHITDGSPCWCNPELNYVDPDTGAKVWVHKEAQ